QWSKALTAPKGIDEAFHWLGERVALGAFPHHRTELDRGPRVFPLELQSKLLRATERLQVTRVGGRSATRINVRLLAATRRNLDHEVQCGRFRDDLFHRISVARIELPPLRERHGDIALLTALFAQQIGGDAGAIPDELLRRWADYNWPGNVRELKNA